MAVRFLGLSSGLDTNTIIDQLMQIERRPIRRSEARISLFEQQAQRWRDLNLSLDGLRSSLQPLLLPSTYNAFTVSSSSANVAAVAVSGPAQAGNYRVSVEQPATRHAVASNPAAGASIAGADLALGLAGSFALGIASAPPPSGAPAESPERWITVQAGDSLTQIARRVNDLETVTGVRAMVVKAAAGDFRLLLESRVEGAQGQISFIHFQPQTPEEEATYGRDLILQHLAITDSAGQFTRELQAALDARLRLNGLEILRPVNTIADLIPGVTLTLKAAGETTVEAAPDLAPVIEAARGFVEAYNQANSMLRDLQDRETGPLQGDPLLMRLERQLRQIASAVLSADADPGAPLRLSDIGIATTDQQGALVLDELKLTAALQADAQAVYRLLGRPPAAGEGAQAGGLARQIRDFAGLVVGAGGVISGRQRFIERQVRDLEGGIERWEQRLELREQNLLRRFTAMERHISMMQGQSGLMDNLSRLLQNTQAE